MDGAGRLTVWSTEGAVHSYDFSNNDETREVVVRVGEMMQWEAHRDASLTFYEICEPPYVDGRFENVTT
jgi:hypothetical protein